MTEAEYTERQRALTEEVRITERVIKHFEAKLERTLEAKQELIEKFMAERRVSHVA